MFPATFRNFRSKTGSGSCVYAVDRMGSPVDRVHCAVDTPVDRPNCRLTEMCFGQKSREHHSCPVDRMKVPVDRPNCRDRKTGNNWELIFCKSFLPGRSAKVPGRPATLQLLCSGCWSVFNSVSMVLCMAELHIWTYVGTCVDMS